MVTKHAAAQRGYSWTWGALIVFAVLVAAVSWALLAPGNGQENQASQTNAGTQLDAVPKRETGDDAAAGTQQSATREPEVDSDSCRIVFSGQNVTEEPLVAKKGGLFPRLPLLTSDAQVFAGWYETEETADNLDRTARVNMARQVECDAEPITLHAAWVSPERNGEEDAEIPVLMYHWFTENPEGEDHWLTANFLYIEDFEDHLKYIKDEEFYLPTWPELEAFIDGDLFLPSKSVILTDDDGHKTWYDLAVPLVEENEVMFTSFVIGARGVGPEVTQYVQKRSHTNEMHEAGENGQGRMVNWSKEEIIADMQESADMIGGAKEVMAYPYGHNDENAWEALSEAGWDLGRTVDYGYVTVGTNKFALPVVRVNYGMGVDALAAAIG